MRTNLEMIRGDTLSFAFEVEFDEAPQKLEKADFSCKVNLDDDEALFHKELGNGINFSKQDGTKMYYIVRIAPEDTENLEAGMYYYDLSIEMNGDVFTILNGTLKIESDVTTVKTYMTKYKGIKEIKKTSTSGLVDTYTITLTDGTTSTFTVTNGDSAYKPAVDALEKRIDNLILSSGNESSAEVIDARTGYDGTAYNTLGTAIRTQVNNLKSNIDNKSGITTNHANTLWAILQKTKFYEQVTTEELNAFKNAWGIKSSSGDDSGGSEESGDDTPTVTYIVTRNLVGCTSNNNVTKIREGSTLNETLTASKGYTLPTAVQGGSISITMSGNEITSNVYDYNTGVINISSVTGNIIINVECAKEAVLPTNGLDDYFDLRNAKLVDLGSYKSYKATVGNGAIFGNANENITTNDKGMLYARYDYSTQGDASWNDYPMPFTFASLTYSNGYKGSSAYMPSNMSKFANNQWNLCPTYNNSSGSTTQLGNIPQGSLTDGYHAFFITAKDKVLKFYLDGNLIQTCNGDDYSDFVSWKSFQRLACLQYSEDHATAFATWNRVLNENELNEVERYFRTLEVK